MGLKGVVRFDFIVDKNKNISRQTNNAGGIEGGMTNGETLIIKATMKPIPTMKKALNSVEIKTHNKVQAHFERADSCAVEACGVVAECMSAIVLLDCFFEKFGADSKRDIDLSFENYLKRINEI